MIPLWVSRMPLWVSLISVSMRIERSEEEWGGTVADVCLADLGTGAGLDVPATVGSEEGRGGTVADMYPAGPGKGLGLDVLAADCLGVSATRECV